MLAGRNQFTVNLKCPDCSALGAAVWEEEGGTMPGPRGKRALISVAGEFHSETGRTEVCDPVIVCNVCDVIQDA